tara:strand:+ start:335 stop:499 length:165 start_codon:yes stop_codon:yes gene_type:complete
MTKDSSTFLFDKIKALKEWDKRLAKKFQDKFNLSDYQMLWVAFIKGIIIGAIVL